MSLYIFFVYILFIKQNKERQRVHNNYSGQYERIGPKMYSKVNIRTQNEKMISVIKFVKATTVFVLH